MTPTKLAFTSNTNASFAAEVEGIQQTIEAEMRAPFLQLLLKWRTMRNKDYNFYVIDIEF